MNLAKFREGSWPVVLVTLLCLLPFINKAFHIDDTLFLWVARQIQERPFDFYGFYANWYGVVMPMAEINQNPPLVSYYIALVTLLFGWQEWTLHLAFLVPALGVTVGTFYLAREFTARPQLAAFVALATPIFLVSATSVMTDVMMMAFYVWAIVLWIWGLERNRLAWLGAASLLIALSALTKYFGLTAIPLLLLYTILRLKRFDRRLAVVLLLALPALLILGYQQLTLAMYGRDLVSAAASYSTKMASRGWSNLLDQSLVGLAFTGGCVASVLFFAPLLWARRTWLVAGGILLVGVLGLLLVKGGIFKLELVTDGKVRWLTTLQAMVFVVAGLHLLILAGIELYQRRDAVSVMLFCWIAGTFGFSTFINWTVNGRTILPMIPAIAILVARRLDARATAAGKRRVDWLPLLPALLLGLAVTWGDFALANTQRQAAAAICQELRPHGNLIWFQGHWGFQYYMEQAGARAVNVQAPTMQPGDFLVLPENNVNIYSPAYYSPYFNVLQMKTYTFPASRWIGTMQRPPTGAGFYAANIGPLPYLFGPIPNENYWLLRRIN